MVENESSPVTFLLRAIDQVGSQSELARRIGSTQGSVWRWLKATPIPGRMVLAIEAATGISRHDLRPDIYPRESVAPAQVQDERTPRAAALDHAARAPFDGLDPAR